jgi:hypothetical protein
MEQNSKRKIPGWARILILLAVLLVVTGAYAALRLYNDRQAEIEDASETILSVKEGQVVSFTYEKDGAVYTFARENRKSDWVYQQDPSLELEQNLVDNVLLTATEITTKQIISENLDEAAEYGLDDPCFTLNMMLKDGTEQVLYLGSVNAMTSDYYAAVEGDGRIFTLSQDFYNSFADVDELAKTPSELVLSDSAY